METEVTETTKSEGQDNNSPNDNIDEPGTVIEQQAFVQPEPEVSVTPRSKMSQYSVCNSMKRPRRLT